MSTRKIPDVEGESPDPVYEHRRQLSGIPQVLDKVNPDTPFSEIYETCKQKGLL